MTPLEMKSSVSLAAVFACRMLGLFMVLPVLALYADELAGSTPLLLGVALGAYGLTQALLQIPFGMLSDRIGRKPVIVVGLLVFACGSLVAAQASSIEGVIIGRLLQGSGAIASTLLALLSDLTSESRRTRAMAFVGMSIGLSFILAMVVGPLLASLWGLDGLFYSNAALAVLALVIIVWGVPNVAARSSLEALPRVAQFSQILRNRELWRLNGGVFVLHFVLMGVFLSLPLRLQAQGVPMLQHAWIYLGALLSSFLLVVPLIILAEKKQRMKSVFCGAIALLVLVFAAFYYWGAHAPWLGLAGVLFWFFVSFNLLEASLPSLVSKTAPAGNRGCAMGIFSSSQFLGAAFGGCLCGLAWQQAQIPGVALLCGGLVLIWLVVALNMRKPRHLRALLLNIAPGTRVLSEDLLQILGVEEALVVESDQLAYLKVDHTLLDRTALARFGAF